MRTVVRKKLGQLRTARWTMRRAKPSKTAVIHHKKKFAGSQVYAFNTVWRAVFVRAAVQVVRKRAVPFHQTTGLPSPVYRLPEPIARQKRGWPDHDLRRDSSSISMPPTGRTRMPFPIISLAGGRSVLSLESPLRRSTIRRGEQVRAARGNGVRFRTPPGGQCAV